MAVVRLTSMIVAANIAPATAAALVPAKLQGVWGEHGRCDRLSDRLTITAHRAGWGKGPFDRVHYDPEDPAIHYDEEGVASNFEMGPWPNVLYFNPEGFHMPGSKLYVRCDRKWVRLPWRRYLDPANLPRTNK